MDLQFIAAELSELDELDSEVLACALWEDLRPSDGLAGLCDWRLGGKLSRLQREGFLSGRLGEVLLLPGRPKLSFDKLMLFGCGPRAQFDEPTFRTVTQHILAAMAGLRVQGLVVQLPGRQGAAIAAERAADMLLEEAGRGPDDRHHDVWTLVEGPVDRRRIEQHMIEERHRVRRFD